MYVCMYVCMHACMYVYELMRACLYVCMHRHPKTKGQKGKIRDQNRQTERQTDRQTDLLSKVPPRGVHKAASVTIFPLEKIATFCELTHLPGPTVCMRTCVYVYVCMCVCTRFCTYAYLCDDISVGENSHIL